MEVSIVDFETRHLVGMKIRTTLGEDRTYELWHAFKSKIKEIQGRVDNNYFSVQQFDKGISFDKLTPVTAFNKWAAVQVDPALELIPHGMEPLLIPKGKYAVFIHKGEAFKFGRTLQYIFGQWLPQSGFRLDGRPQFEIMGSNYRPDDPNAKEEVWVPVI